MKTLEQKINEIFNPIPTPYKPEQVNGKYVKGKKDLRCYFKTNSGNEYAVDFFVLEEPKTILINGKSIIEASLITSKDKEHAYLIGLGFSLKKKG